MVERRIDEHTLEQAREHAFDRDFPTAIHVQGFT